MDSEEREDYEKKDIKILVDNRRSNLWSQALFSMLLLVKDLKVNSSFQKDLDLSSTQLGFGMKYQMLDDKSN